jgi:streptomycin 6-kinase
MTTVKVNLHFSTRSDASSPGPIDPSAFASGAGNNEGILMVWRYAYTGPSAAWAHGEAPAWT